MKSRTGITLAAIVLALGLFCTLAFARSNVLGASGFQSNGDRIAGWQWLRANGHSATWTFNTSQLAGAKPGSVYLNFAPLVTNGASGGSGYDLACRVTVEGATSSTLMLPLSNPFRPTDPEHSSGVGYQVYGHTSSPIPEAVLRGANSITVTVSYPFRPNHHLAVNRDAMTIGYSR
jgi:hypothetical protein